jgi:hypothetical protein
MASALFYSRYHHFAVSGIRPVYSVSNVPGLYQFIHPVIFQLSLQTKHFR